MASASSASNVVQFPLDRRRSPLVVQVETLLRRRWNDVVAEPLPDKWLELLGTLERSQQPDRRTDKRK